MFMLLIFIIVNKNDNKFPGVLPVADGTWFDFKFDINEISSIISCKFSIRTNTLIVDKYWNRNVFKYAMMY